ncbi:FG-GAP-like repeat-containing protein [Paracidobacterium acidisoli]|uniref:FG-GAP-like repeat-containing protein n=1 Tax=Paracidobacterium acidisoli TaxID=2303751 RepID=UPI0013146C6D|nr:FG-GAP-like repeat-containing protein [Paracidobacterium acidisoli]MBT9330823.1 VCBS repeat-containing protein [Paracidobacterium acidisoli]
MVGASCLLLSASPGFAQTPSFSPDKSFQGSSLDGWHTMGSAKWQAENGTIDGDGRAANAPGWLVLDHPYQDTGVYASFKCEGPCDTGILLRAVKTGNYIQGVFLSIKQNDLAAYRVTLDASGNEIERTKLRNAGGLIRFAPPLPSPAEGPEPPLRRPVVPAPAGETMPLQLPARGLKMGDWNEVEVLLDADIIRAFFNDGGAQVSTATEGMDAYGPFALYVGAGTEVHFHNIAWKDLAFKNVPVEKVSPRFHEQRLSPFYYGWSAAAADFDRDGNLDIVSGPFIYYGPDYTRYREIYPAQGYNSSTEFSSNDWVEHAYDFTGDGWPDVLTTSHAGGGLVGAVLYVNPKGESRRWKSSIVVSPINSEETILADVDGDGKPELVYMGDDYMCYAKPDPKDPTKPWIVHRISEKGPWPAHGIGAGDINGDGRVDIVGAYGWWEQPASDTGAPWKYHPEPFGRWGRTSAGGSEIGVYDVNGDGLNDVVTVMQAHGWGIDWFEQKRSADGQISFVKHVIMGKTPEESAGGVVFTEPHGSTIADVDGDGIPDFIVGKRLWSHLDDYYDPDPYGAPVLYWFRTVRDPKAPGGARFEPELIDNRSGAGSDVLAVDLNKDGAIDIVTSVRSGTYIFWGTPGKQASHK